MFRAHTIFSIMIVTLVAASANAADLPGTGADAGKTVVYRDTWGVPHIYAPTVEAGFYAMGWAQAEDRPHELLKNLMRGMGESARVDGPGAVETDQVARLWDLYEGSKRLADRIRPEVLSHLQAFVRGANAFYAAHPNDVPAWWGNRPVDEFMIVAFSRLFLQSWSFDDGFDDLKRGGIEPGVERVPRGSNQFAIAPSRSAVNAAILCIDPHLGWLGASRFWEFRIHASELQGSGFTLAGVPYIGLGHNENVAWAMTTGGPDTADVYELTVNPDDPSQYLYDGQWRQMTSRETTIEIKGEKPVTLRIWESHHGPVAARKGSKAYVVKSAYADAVQGNEAWYEFNFAKDYRGIIAGLATLQVFPQNTMVADTSGNIYYQRTGRVPRRPSGYDWSRPVDGSTSATEWQGFHPATDHLQVLNPPQGYMQNCNIPPDAMMVNSPFSVDKTLPYIFADLSHSPQRDGWTNQRGARAVELLDKDASVTIKEAKAYATDRHPYGVERWLGVLKDAHARFGVALQSDRNYADGIKDILRWDENLDPDSTGALKYYYWRKQIVDDLGDDAASKLAKKIDYLLAALGKPAPPIQLTDEEQRGILKSFAVGMGKLKADLGSLDKTYGDVFRVGRDDKSWPLGGGGDGNKGLTTFRNVGYGKERPDHTRWGQGGQTSTEIVVLTKPIKSWTYVPLGQSDRPESAHYTDQAENAFSPAQMKPTWWTPKELAKHIESRTTLEGAR
ncbi:MAG: penicillin acylase family protein [Candidatus Hydrogenedentes bacterium]|nr:penicillin acylase family protein [Candidatus Hydrogenedentota bacterium]